MDQLDQGPMKLMDRERHAIVEHHGSKVDDDGLG
jgi:hypothetical protein